ncbi:Leucine-specific-binding protein [subsurface metagenome]
MRKVKIAFVAPMTGDQSIVAIPMLKVAEMAKENLKLSNIYVNVIGFDDLADPKKAVKVAREIANDQDIIAVVGNKNSATLEAAGSIYEKNSLSFITASATNDDLSQKGWKGFF